MTQTGSVRKVIDVNEKGENILRADVQGHGMIRFEARCLAHRLLVQLVRLLASFPQCLKRVLMS
jgi:hypothetical protein